MSDAQAELVVPKSFLTQTVELAISALVFLAQRGGADPVSPRQIAIRLRLSSSYTAKVTRLLVKAGILAAHKGALGGVHLNQLPSVITLLSVVEACQGRVVTDEWKDHGAVHTTGRLDELSTELNHAIIDVLSRWTLSDIVARPRPSGDLPCVVNREMSGGQSAARRRPARKRM